MNATDFWPSASRRPVTTTLAPCPAKATAVARPMPAVPPVMRTTFSAKTGGEDAELMVRGLG